MIKYSIAFVAWVSLFATACHKSHDSGGDPIPVLTLTSPVTNQVYANGDSIKIQGVITDNSLHSLTLSITSGSTSLYTKTISVHDSTHYVINDGWKASVTSVTNAIVTAMVEDHGGHTVGSVVSIRIDP